MPDRIGRRQRFRTSRLPRYFTTLDGFTATNSDQVRPLSIDQRLRTFVGDVGFALDALGLTQLQLRTHTKDRSQHGLPRLLVLLVEFLLKRSQWAD